MRTVITTESQQQLFTEARTHRAWLDKPVSDEQLRAIYELTKWGPTSVNCQPARIVFVVSPEGKEKLMPALAESNRAKVKAASATAIVAYDENFYQDLPTLFAAYDAKSFFVGNEVLIQDTAFRNSSLQGAYLMIAVRAMGLDVGPISGFDNAGLDQAFFAGTSWKSNFICNIGHGDESKLHPRGPRLGFERACRIV